MDRGSGTKNKEVEELASKLWKEELGQSSEILAKVIQAQPPGVREELVTLLMVLSDGNPILKNNG